MAEGVLGMECLSPWLCEGNLEGGLPPGNPKGYLEKSLGRVSLYIGAPYTGSVWGTWRTACLPGTLRVG